MAGQDVKIKIGAVDQTKAAFNSVNKSLGGLKTAAIGVSAALTAVVGARVVTGIVDANRSFQRLQASLKTFTGSAEAAASQFAKLEQFASTTPFSLEEVVGGFNILVARGLQPSIKALESFGNISAGTGKSLNQLIEAVADASVGEFERLKEFGIKANVEGDKVKMTFAGVTTTIGKNADEIVGYLEKLGETKFAGALGEQAKTLDGAFSNFGDAVDALSRAIGEAGLNDFLISATRTITGFINEVTEVAGRLKTASSFAELFGGEIGKLKNEIDEAEKSLERYNRRLQYSTEQQHIDRIIKGAKELARLRFMLAGAEGGEAMFPPLVEIPTKKAAPPKVVDEKALEKARKAAEARTDSQFAQIEAVYKKLYQENQQRLETRKRLFEETRTPAEQLNIKLNEFNKLLMSGIIPFEVYNRLVVNAKNAFEDTKEAIEATKTPLEQYRDGIKTIGEEIQISAVRGLKSLEDNLTAVVMGTKSAKDAFADMARSIISDLIRIQIRKSIVEPLSGYLDTAIGSITGTRAMGGSVTAGKSYLVGEQGAELFVPGQTGTIVPNNKMSSDGVTVVQNINVTTGVQQTVRAEIMTLMPQIANAAKSAVADAKLRGGSYAAALR
ncbi:MAG: tape measure protein [Ilumatobacteraceae bacterium]